MTQRIVRRRLMGRYDVDLQAPPRAGRAPTGALQIGLTFGAVLVTATVLLSLGITNAGAVASPLEALFTSVSAITGTGLVVVDTQSQFNFAGELVIYLVIQVGGLGYMLGVSAILWVIGGRLHLRDQQMLRLYHGLPSVGETLEFVRRLAVYALLCQAAGAAALWVGFTATGVGGGTAVWWAIFHSASAFNEAGFSLTGADLVPWVDEPLVMVPSAILAVLGALGALPVLLLLQNRGRRLPLDARVILLGTGAILLVAWGVMGIAEWQNGATVGSVGPAMRPLLALEQSAMWATGFSAFDIGALHDYTQFFLIGMMFIGGAAGSAAAGVKVGAFFLLLAMIVATLRGREEIVILGTKVPFIVVRQAMVLALGLVGVIFVLTVSLLTVSDRPALAVLFEAVAATSNVAWTPLRTAEWDTAGRLFLIAGMLIGRLAPLLLILEMTYPRTQSSYRFPADGVRLG